MLKKFSLMNFSVIYAFAKSVRSLITFIESVRKIESENGNCMANIPADRIDDFFFCIEGS